MNKDSKDEKINTIEKESPEKKVGETEVGAPGDKDSKEFVFMREQIKARPINKGKLARNTFVSALSAVIFGLVACVTFFLLAPVVSGYFEKDEEVEEEKPNVVVFPEETIEEEMKPEDMLITSEPEIDWSEIEALSEEEIAKAISSIEFTVADYQKMYRAMTSIAETAQKSLVRVRSVKTDTDWFDNMFEETDEVPGLAVADNGVNLYFVSYASKLSDAEDIYITFSNEVSVRAHIQATDPYTDMCILYVPCGNVNVATRKGLEIANLGISNSSSLRGGLVIAIGSPMGSYGSLNIGLISLVGKSIDVTDNNYKKLYTDIYGSTNAMGVLVNLRGEIIGLIDTKYVGNDSKNLISAIGISELKKTIENMINEKPLTYVGVHGAKVPDEAISQYEVPNGAFIISVEMDSPAMLSGIQAGDIVVGVGGKIVVDYNTLVAALRELEPDVEVQVRAYRFGQDGYKEMTFSLIPSLLQ